MTAAFLGVLLLALAGLPLFAGLSAVGLLGLAAADTPLSAGIADVYRLAGPEAVSLSTIPLFTFAGYLMASAGTAKRLLRLAEAVFGWVPGGLAVVAVVTCAFFTTFTGASGVTIVAVGGLLLPALERAGYGKRFSLEVVTGSGAVGLLFPPALPLIVYGIVFGLTWGNYARIGEKLPEFGIERFLFAGIVPGLLLVALLAGYCVVVGWRARVPRTPIDLRAFARAAWQAKWELPIPFVVVVALARGWTTIPESAALTAIYVLAIEVLVYRDVPARSLPRLVRDSMTLVGAIFMKIVGATLLTSYFVDSGIPQALFGWLGGHVHGAAGFLLILNLVLLAVGSLMDVFSAILVMVPLVVPAAAAYHLDPYHLGVVFLLNLELGYLLPPAGLNLFIAAYRFDRPIAELYRAVWPFLLLMAAALALVTWVPALTVVPAGTPPSAAGLP